MGCGSRGPEPGNRVVKTQRADGAGPDQMLHSGNIVKPTTSAPGNAREIDAIVSTGPPKPAQNEPGFKIEQRHLLSLTGQ